MSTTLSNKPRTAQQRNVEATRRLCETLGVDDLKLLAAALAEVATEEVSRNPAYARRVRATYDELSALKPSRSPRRSKREDIDLVPIVSPDDVRQNPFGALDPYELLRVYGKGQLRAALSRYSLTKLKEAATLVEQKNPGSRPKSRSRKEDVIDYVVETLSRE